MVGIPTFACVAGVVVETGGTLSHGSIILREIGLPAITNGRGVTRVIQTGDELVLRAGSGWWRECRGVFNQTAQYCVKHYTAQFYPRP